MYEPVTADELSCFCGKLKNPLFSFASCEHSAFGCNFSSQQFPFSACCFKHQNIPQLSATANCRLTNKHQENRRLGASHMPRGAAELSQDSCHLVCSVTQHPALQGWDAKGELQTEPGSHKQNQSSPKGGLKRP